MPQAAPSRPAHDLLDACARDATAAVEALLADAVARSARASRPRAHRRRGCRSRAARHPRPCLARDLCRGGAPTRRLCGADEASGRLGEIEELLVRIGLGEYLAQILGGIPMSQGEIVRPADLGLSAAAVAARVTPAVEALIASGNTAQHRARLVELMRAQPRRRRSATAASTRRSKSIREEMRKFADSEVDRRTRRAGTAPTATFRSRSSRRWPSSACSA